jgi:hypothetical protein
LGAAFPVTSTGSFTAQLSRLAENPELLNKCSEIAKNYVKNNGGATRKILQEVFHHEG